jgi:hypothetical protein
MNRSDENWELARSIQLTPSRDGIRPGYNGVVTAEPHPAGWFISARFDPDLSAAEIQDFAQFVTVRTYLLLDRGPDGSEWEPTRDGVWRADCVAAELDLDAEYLLLSA